MIVSALLYVLDRRAKSAGVDYVDLGKITLGAGAVTTGVVYALGGEVVEEAVKTATDAASSVQDMFVGKPNF